MNTKIYFENVAATITEHELKGLFSAYGNIAGIDMAIDRNCGWPRTFGFVTMVTPEGAQAAVKFLNGKLIGAHTIIVTAACPPTRWVLPSKARRNPRRRSSHLF